MDVYECMCMCVCVCARAHVHACLHACVPVCVCVCVSEACPHAWRPEVYVGCLPHFSPYFLRQDLLLNLELTYSARLAGL